MRPVSQKTCAQRSNWEKSTAEVPFGRQGGADQVEADLEDVLPVVGHVLRIDPEHLGVLLPVGRIDAVPTLELGGLRTIRSPSDGARPEARAGRR